MYGSLPDEELDSGPDMAPDGSLVGQTDTSMLEWRNRQRQLQRRDERWGFGRLVVGSVGTPGGQQSAPKRASCYERWSRRRTLSSLSLLSERPRGLLPLLRKKWRVPPGEVEPVRWSRRLSEGASDGVSPGSVSTGPGPPTLCPRLARTIVFL